MKLESATVCGILSIVVGIIAAIVWIWSALVPLPVPTEAVLLDASNPFIVAVHYAACLNAWAAGLTAASVFLAAAERGIRMAKRWLRRL